MYLIADMMTSDTLIQAAMIFIGVAVAWLVIRTVMKLALKVFMIGCGVIVIGGIGFLLFQLLGG